VENHTALSFEVRSDNIGVFYFDSPARRVNTFTPTVLEDLRKTLADLNRSATLYGLIFTSRKANSCCAGADLDMLLDARLSSEKSARIAQIGQDLANLIEQMPFPTLAAIDGGCLGGGLELALACDFRLVTSQATTLLGFPEVKLGLIPGWGGTQRLPRIVGLENAIELITRGHLISARRSVEIGLAWDQVAGDSFFDG
jgi:enoyl-CoA hydratase/carnithine racemase